MLSRSFPGTGNLQRQFGLFLTIPLHFDRLELWVDGILPAGHHSCNPMHWQMLLGGADRSNSVAAILITSLTAPLSLSTNFTLSFTPVLRTWRNETIFLGSTGSSQLLFQPTVLNSSPSFNQTSSRGLQTTGSDSRGPTSRSQFMSKHPERSLEEGRINFGSQFKHSPSGQGSYGSKNLN